LLFTSLYLGFIICKCDTAECRAANVTECKADFYCYVSFRPARPSEQKPSNSKTIYGAGSRLFIAEQRGCASHEQMDLCMNPRNNVFNGGGGFGDLNSDDGSRSTIIRCCSDNYCEISRKLEFTPAELEGRQFFLNAEISDLEPGLDFPMVENGFPPFRESPKASSNSALILPHRKRENTEPLQQKQRKRPAYPNDVPFAHQWFAGVSNPLSSPSSHDQLSSTNVGTHVKSTNQDALVKREEIYRTPVQLKQMHKESDDMDEERKEEKRQIIAFQPLHIAIGVCLIILMLVAVLLHVVVILHKRHRRLKRELMKQTQKTTSNDLQHNWVISSPSQGNEQHINLQQLKYISSSTEQNPQTASKSSDRSCCISCVWKRPRNKMTSVSTNVCDEVLSHQTPIATPVMAAVPTPETQFRQCLPHGPPAPSTQTPVTYHSSLHSSVATPPTLPVTQAISLQQNPMMSVLQPTPYSPHSPEHTIQLNQVKNTYGTGSSVSGGSGNNPSTAESSLPTHSSVVNGWSNMNSTQAFFLHNGLTHSMQRTSQLERPSLSGSSEAGGLITPDFEARRANVALPPALQGGDHTCSGISSPQTNTTSLALFRSAVPQHDTCSLVTPYAQLQLSLSFDQYDTPEQIFGNGTVSAGGSSLDGMGNPRNNNQASSNPTTNSSLLHSYCEHAGNGDFRV
ncbi:unnamed protein product, partial [Hymenolepis diminuta]|uniref:Activin_recp domain-containing protein n=1 Tax=Hymenolepis diminuta TaxID=6216 RepID=A0A0R3S8B9_HYMDI